MLLSYRNSDAKPALCHFLAILDSLENCRYTVIDDKGRKVDTSDKDLALGLVVENCWLSSYSFNARTQFNVRVTVV